MQKKTSPQKNFVSFPLSLSRRGVRGEVRQKKSLGQNFLKDPKILKKIVDFAQIEPQDTVVEVGPGEGGLTKILLTAASKVIAVEKDEKLAERLEQNFSEEIKDNRLEIVVGDILDYNLKSNNYKLVGNIPYYITGALFKKFLDSENPPQSITFVIQKEVAERIIARDSKESILSISVKVYGKPEYGGVIKAGSFTPAPKVDSAIIAVRNISKERFEGITPHLPIVGPLTSGGEPEKRFFEILKAGFAHKRKLLIKNLGDMGKSERSALAHRDRLKEIFGKYGISEKTRAEDIKVEDWVNIARELN